MTALQWSQVHAWRLSQHGLSPRFSSQDFMQAVMNLFCSSTTAIRKGIAAETERLSHLFEKAVVLEDESPSSPQL